MERVYHAANTLDFPINGPHPWDRLEVDVWQNGGNFRINHDIAIGPFTVGKRGHLKNLDWRPKLGLEWRTLYFERYLDELPGEWVKLPNGKSTPNYTKDRPDLTPTEETRHLRTPRLLIDLKGSWDKENLSKLYAMTRVPQRKPQSLFDIFCTQNWSYLNAMACGGVPRYQLCYSASTVDEITRLAAVAYKLSWVSLDYTEINDIRLLDPFCRYKVGIFMWNLPKNFYDQERFQAIRELGIIAGLTLDRYIPSYVEL